MQNFSEPFISPLFSSGIVQFHGKPEIAIAEYGCCFYLTIFVDFDVCLESLSKPYVSTAWQRQPDNLPRVPGTLLNSLNSKY